MITHPRSSEQISRDREERVQRFRSLLSTADRTRIAALAREVSPSFIPARIEGLDAKFAVQCVPADSADRFSGEVIAVVRNGSVAVLAYA